MFESRISARAVEELPSIEKPDANISSWSYDVEGHAKKCVERHYELAKKTTQHLYKVATPCTDDHQFKEEEMRSVGEFSKVYSQIFLKCQHLACIDRPDILWSVNKLARAFTEWTRACDKRSARLISYIHHTCEFNQCCFVGNTAQQCRLGFFQDSDLAGDLEDPKINIRWTLVHFRKSNISANKLDVQETDPGLTQFSRSRAYLSWCRFTHGWNTSSWSFGYCYRSFSFFTKPIKENQRSSTRKLVAWHHIKRAPKTELQTQPSTTILNWVVLIMFRRTRSLTFLRTMKPWLRWWFKGRSPTMRHVSRTHWVALDRLFDRIYLDPKIQIKYIDTKHQVADILTKGNFTRDEWNNLIHLFNISHSSSTCCANNFSLTGCTKTMAKRVQEQKEEEKIVAKWKLTAMNLSSSVPASSSSAKNQIAWSDPVKLMAAGKLASRMRRNSKPDEAPSSQVKLKNAYLGGLMDKVAGKPVATEENQALWELSESESWSIHEDEVRGKPVAYKKDAVKLAASSIFRKLRESWSWKREMATFFYMSPAVVPHMERVYSIVRKTYDRASTWTRLFGNVYEYHSSSTVHLGQDFEHNLRFIKNHFSSSLKRLFKETERLIKDQTEISGVSMIDCEEHTWSETSLLCDKAYQITNAKTYVFADSVLCLGGIKEIPNEAWKEKI